MQTLTNENSYEEIVLWQLLLILIALTWHFGQSEVRYFLIFSVVFVFLRSKAFETKYYLLLASIPFSGVMKLTVSSTFSVISVLMVLGSIYYLQRVKFQQSTIFLFVLLLLAGAFSLESTSMNDFFSWIVYLLFLIIPFCRRFEDTVDYRIASNTVFVSFLTSSLVGWVFPSILKSVQWDKGVLLGGLYSRFQGLYRDPNYFAQGLAVSLSLSLYMNRDNKSPAQLIIFSFLYVAALYFGLSSFSRMFLLCFPFLILQLYIWLYRQLKSHKSRLTGLLFLSVILISVSVLILVSSGQIFTIFEFFSQGYEYRFRVGSFSGGRIGLQASYLEAISRSFEDLAFGFGLSGKMIVVFGGAPHNLFLHILFSVGFAGSATLLLLLMNLFKHNKEHFEKRGISLFPSIIFLITCFSLDGFTQPMLYFYVPLLLHTRFSDISVSHDSRTA